MLSHAAAQELTDRLEGRLSRNLAGLVEADDEVLFGCLLAALLNYAMHRGIFTPDRMANGLRGMADQLDAQLEESAPIVGHA